MECYIRISLHIEAFFSFSLLSLDSLPLCTLSAWILISRTPVEASVEVNIPRITATVVSHLDPTSEVGGGIPGTQIG